jgi:hypothetical protein
VTFPELLQNAARWFLLGNIFLAAWLYGGTREWTREWVTWLLLFNSAIFVAGVIARIRRPSIPLPAALAAFFLLSQAIFLAWNSKRRFIPSAQVFVDRLQPMPGWPGYLDAEMVWPTVMLTAGLLGAFCIACDMASQWEWRERLWVSIAGTGVSIVLLGLAQRFSEAQDIFWGLDTSRGLTFFSVYRYHANAGTFINLVLPLQVALAVRSLRRDGAEGAKVVWSLSAFITAAAGFVNVSKAANLICLGLLIFMAAWFGSYALRSGSARGWLIAAVSVLTVAIIAASFGLEKTILRWGDEISSRSSVSSEGRLQAYEIICKGALPEVGWWGFGPGTFEKVFDIDRAALGSPLEGRWDKAHSDALQTPMEWGWAGAAAWMVILAGGFWRSVGLAAKKSEDALLNAGCAMALGGVMVHALVDFPLQIASLQLITIVIAGLSWGFPKQPIGSLRQFS